MRFGTIHETTRQTHNYKRFQAECFEGDGGGHDFGCGNASGKC
jgi:hypothetical protein